MTSMQVTPTQTVEIKPSWAFTLSSLSFALRDGEGDQRDALMQVTRAGMLLDRTLEFVESQGLTSILKAFLEGYEQGARR